MPSQAKYHAGAEDRTSSWRLLGLAFWQAWWMIGMCTDTFLPETSRSPFPGHAMLCALFFSTLVFALIVALSNRFSPLGARKPSFLLAGGLTSVGSALQPFSLLMQPGEPCYLLFVAATLAVALGNALLIIMWGELLSSLAAGRVGSHLYASYTLAFVLFFAVDALPRPASVLCAAALPAISAAILLTSRNEPRRAPSPVPLDAKTIPLARALISIFAISLIYGLSQGMIGMLTHEKTFLAKELLFAGSAMAAITLSMMAAPSLREPIALYRPIMPVMITGFVLLLLPDAPCPFIGGGLVIAGVFCLDIFMMLASTDVAFRARIPVAFSFGLVILISRLGTFVGLLAASSLRLTPFWSSNLVYDAFLVEVLALALVGMLLFTQTEVKRLYQTPAPTPREASLEEKCARVARMSNLTNRESEVLVLLARGRTVPKICQELSIAQGTAKHHVSSIYRKIGVVDRQDLLDIIEQADVDLSLQEGFSKS